MAVTIDALLNSLRAGDSEQERLLVGRMLTAAHELIGRYSPNAPESIQEEAIYRLVAYWFDMPNTARGAGYGNALRNSGAQAILSPYRAVKARVVS